MGYKFVKTEDGSPGLYNNEVNDIYHSSSGAYKEALDKFVIPAQIERFKNSKCKVLDICYGIGYNTKALLNYSINNNLNINFEIDALDIDKELITLSPFINLSKLNINFDVDIFILKSLLEHFNIDFPKIKSIINKNNNFLTLYKPEFDKIFKYFGYNYGVYDNFNFILHNIYYQYRSLRNKIPQKSTKLNKSSIKWHVGDARESIFKASTNYDIIFHDGFTAAKQPTLWTKEFISLICKLLNKNSGVIVSYSTASPFRKALIDNKLNVGKFYLKNINSTLASYDINLVKYLLEGFELNLLYTKAGIPYTDKNFSLNGENILSLRAKSIKNSNLESTSNYYKINGRKHGAY